MSPRPDASAERIPQIINAAMVVFAEKGFHPATMEDVAKEAGLSKGTLYLYFKNKDDLIFSVLQASLAEGFTALEQILSVDGPIKPHLLNWVETMAQRLENSAVYLSIGYEFYALAARDEQIRQALNGYFDKYRNVLTNVIAKGIEQKEFNQVNPKLIAVSMIALFEGVNVLWYTSPREENWESISVQTIELLLDSVSPRGEHKT